MASLHYSINGSTLLVRCLLRFNRNQFHGGLTVTRENNLFAAFRAADEIKPGQQCEIERIGKGEYRLHVKDEKPQEPEESWVDILLACPVKGWYVPMEREQTTDDLKPVFD